MESVRASPISRAAVLSTGVVRIRPEHARRTWKPLAAWLLTSRRWTAALPINVYVIEHDGRLVLFDAGQDRRSVSDPAYFPGGVIGWLFRRLARFEIGADETLPALLRAAGLDPGAVSHIVLSHLHQDHIGGIADFPQAELVTTTIEWEQLRRRGAVLDGYLRRHIDLPGARWTRIDFRASTGEPFSDFGPTHDLLGDGTLRLISTPGHTPGSLSMLVSVDGEPTALLVGDLTYDAHRLDEGHVPGVGDRKSLHDTTRRMARLASTHPTLAIAAAHDPGAADAFRRAFDREFRRAFDRGRA